MKRVSVIISIVALFAVAYWAFHAFVNKQQEVFDPLSVIPEDALLIVELRNGGKEAANFYQRSMLWKDFENTPFAIEAKPFFELLDSLSQEHQIVISLHEGQKENYSLITLTDPDQKLQNLLKNFGATKDKVASSHIYSIIGLPYFFETHESFIRIAKDRDFLTRTQNYIDQGKSILTDSSFIAIRPALESGNDLKLYVDLEDFSQSVNKKIIEDIFDFPKDLKGWFATDLYDKANTIVSSGFIEFNASENNFFSPFEGQVAQGLHYFDILPANTAILTASAYSNPHNFLKKLSIDPAIKSYFSTWLGNSFGSGILNGDKAPSDLRFAFFEIRDNESFTEKTKAYIDPEFQPLVYKNYEILRLDSSFKLTGFTEGISTIEKPYFALLKEYVVFSHDQETIKEIIKRFSNDNTLSLQESFSNLRDELSDETNFLFYISPAMAGSFLKAELADSLRNYWLPQEEKINSLQAMIVQVSSYKKGKMYVHSALRHQVVNFQEKDNSLWEVYFDVPLKGDVHLVRNHYTQHLEMAVQDTNNMLFVVNNKGEILWNTQLDGEIIGPIHQIDRYKNGKLQILFNTSTTIYSFDRKGNKLDGFPLELSNSTANPLALFDYDSNKNYRILASFPDGNMDMYDIEGNKLKGWKFKKVRSAIVETPQHFKIGKKDYIYTSTGNGTALLMDRQGKTRFKVKENIAEKNGEATIYTGKSISSSGIYYIDTLGAVINLPFGGEKEYLAIKGEKGDDLAMERINSDNSREFILYNRNKIDVFELNGNKLFDKIEISALNGAPKIYRFNQKNWLGYSDDNSKEAFLIDANGNIKQDSPYAGIGRFSIGDINKDGILEFIIQGENGQLVAYSLSK